MKKSYLFTLLLILLLVGCATYAEMRQMDKFEETAEEYKRAIAWSDYDVASTFMETEDSEKTVAELDKIRGFKVASYDLKRAIPSADKSKVVQLVDISYFRINTLVLKRLTDRQVWEWNTEKEEWILTSGLPQFK